MHVSNLTPNNRIPFHGVLFPVKRCGNFMGKITASFKASLAASSPAISDHLTLGLTPRILSSRAACSFFFSESPSSSDSLSFSLDFLGEKRMTVLIWIGLTFLFTCCCLQHPWWAFLFLYPFLSIPSVSLLSPNNVYIYLELSPLLVHSVFHL